MKILIAFFLLLTSLASCGGMSEASFPIVSIERDSLIHGSFFLGTGSIDEVMYYFAYTQLSDGGFYLAKMRISRSIIYETDSAKPYVRVWWNTAECLTSQFDWGNSPFWKRIEIYVPKNTIIKEFHL